MAWRSLVRRTDTLARTGGDEFLLVCIECDLLDAERMVRRMIVETPEGVGCSAGLARGRPTDTPTSLIERANEALYVAKMNGPLAVADDAGLELSAHSVA